jgi:hypothetical protein
MVLSLIGCSQQGLYEKDSLPCLFQQNCLVNRLVHILHATRTPHMAPSSEDMPIEDRRIEERPTVIVCELCRITQQMGDHFYLRQRPLREDPVRNPHQELSRLVMPTTIVVTNAMRGFRILRNYGTSLKASNISAAAATRFQTGSSTLVA